MKRFTMFLLAALGGALIVAAQAPQQDPAKQTTRPLEYVLKQTLTGATGSVVFSPDGAQLASGSEDKTVKLWAAQTGSAIRTLTGFAKGVLALSYSPDGRLLAATGVEDKTVKLWDVQTGAEAHTLTAHTKGVNCLAFSPDGRLLASAAAADKVQLWDVQTGALVRTLTGQFESLLALAFSPDGRQLAGASFALEVRVWNVETGALIRQFGQKVRTLRTHRIDMAFDAAFSSDAQLLAVVSFENHGVLLTDAQTGIVLRALPDTAGAGTLCFSRDGRLLASGFDDGAVKIFEVQTGAMIQTLTGHTKKVEWVAFSPDGRMIASSSADMTVKLWQRPTVE